VNEQAMWVLEERFWLEGSSDYDNLLDPACLMAFSGMGVMRAAEILDSLKQAPPVDVGRYDQPLRRPIRGFGCSARLHRRG
jgi:hypothetical protein